MGYKINLSVATISAAVFLVVGTANAGDSAAFAPANQMVEAVAATQDTWAGAYVGGMYGNNSATYEYESGSSSYGNDLEGTTFGGFAGYNIQDGALVYGGELAYAVGSVYNPNAEDDDRVYEFTSVLDARA